MEEINKILRRMPQKCTIKELLYASKGVYNGCPIVKEIYDNKVVEISYLSFLKKIEKLGSKLLWEGLNKSRIIVIGSANHQWLMVYFATICYGSTIVPIDPNLAFDDLECLVEKAEPGAIFFGQEVSKKIDRLKNKGKCPSCTVCFQELNSFIGNVVLRDVETVAPSEEDTAMITFTSGTTGANKGVVLSQKNLFDNVICSAYILGNNFARPGECTVCVLPFHHMLGVTTTILLPLFYGISICLMGTERNMVKAFQEYNPIYIVGVPMIVDGLIKYANRMAELHQKEGNYSEFLRGLLGTKLKVFVCGGAYLSHEEIDIFSSVGLPLLNGYGITECSPVVSCNLVGKQKKGSVGKIVPSPFCEVKIVQDEIYIRGTIVTKGYYNDLESTEALFDQGWLRTGDLGYIDEDGYLFISGRKKNVIILKDGNNVSPEEIEKYFLNSPLIDNILVNVKIINNLDVIVAYIYPSEGARKNCDIKEQLDTMLININKKLPRYMQVHHLEIVNEAFEVTALGKVKRYKYV